LPAHVAAESDFGRRPRAPEKQGRGSGRAGENRARSGGGFDSQLDPIEAGLRERIRHLLEAILKASC
jgi:hypothetical protein